MSRRAKQFCLVVFSLMGCVAVGLWVQHRYICSALRRTATDQAWRDLKTTGDALLARLGDAGVLWSAPGPGLMEQACDLLGSVLLTGDTQIALVDSNWQLAGRVPMSGSTDAESLPIGARIVWSDSAAPPFAITGANTGTITMPDGVHMALSYPLPEQSGFILLHASQEQIRSRVAAATRSFPLVGLMTLVWTVALLSVILYMILSRFYEELDRERRRSEDQSLRRIQTLVRTRDAVVFGLAKLADSRDPETGDHLERIALYSSTLASALRRDPKYIDLVTPNFVRLITVSSVLHDIGKVGIEDSILLKPGKLTESERTRMQRHSVIGGDCLREIEQRLGSSNFLQMAREIAYAHHERWDGGGYPYGLKGEAIPLSARIVAIADVYDALASKRVYKDAFAHERCVEIICKDAGSHFDPDLVRIWMNHTGRFRDIARRYGGGKVPVGSGAGKQEQKRDQAEAVPSAPALAAGSSS